MPTQRTGSGGNGTGFLRTISSRSAVSSAGEQVEHDVAREPGGGDAEAGEAEGVADAAADGGAVEGGEPGAGVDHPAPGVAEAQARELREGREEVLGEHARRSRSRCVVLRAVPLP